MPIRRRPLGRALAAVILLAGQAAAVQTPQSQTTPRAAPAESAALGYRHPGWQASGFRGASVPHSSTGHVASPTEAAPSTGAPAPRESRGGGSSQSIDPIPINTYHMGPRPQ